MRNFTVSEYTAYVLVNSIFLWAFSCTQLRSARNPRTLADTKPNTPIKVIPLFCTAQTLLRIILRHPRWRRFFPLARKEQTRDAFAELKLSFAIIMPQIGWQLAGLLSKTRKWKKCAWSRSVQWFSLRGRRQLYGSSTALTSQYLAWDRNCTYVVQTPGVERRIFMEQIRLTEAPEPRERD